MRCGSGLVAGAAGRIGCEKCGNEVPTLDGIIDFVGGSSKTKLDDIDYDRVYGIDEQHSLSLYHLLLRSAGPLWMPNFGDALEIGCGTGGLSLALLSNISARRVVVTDVSPKMLRLCRERLRRAGILSDLAFATYSGAEICFRSNVFDTCFGTAVVHHVTDVQRFLQNVQALLKPGGCAFFMEPSLPFHSALTATMADVVAELLIRETVPQSDISLMLNWTGEVHCNIVNTGDIDVLAEREDKHLFVAETFERWAKTAGFVEAIALPCDLDPTGWGTIQVYLRQGGVSPEAFAELQGLWPTKHRRHFERLAERDRSPSYLFWMRKGSRKRVGDATLQAPVNSVTPANRSPSRPVRISLQLRLHRRERHCEITASGWCLAAEPVRSVQFSMAGIVRRVPIWRPRPDVQMLLNRDNTYASLNALCSGIEGTIRLDGLDQMEDTIQVGVQIVAVDGTLLPVGTATLTADGEPAQISHTLVQ